MVAFGIVRRARVLPGTATNFFWGGRWNRHDDASSAIFGAQGLDLDTHHDSLGRIMNQTLHGTGACIYSNVGC